ncbi:MAG: hypothetical protein J0I92_17275 [Phyllobacterium sp.]|nr:hypothetical protein [Phyllobacterium sp.]
MLLISMLLLVARPDASLATERRVTYANIVRPSLELLEALAKLRSLSAPGNAKNIKGVEAYFAPETKTFSRGLDPFQRWKRGKSLTHDYLAGAADIMVEQGEFAAGLKVPDYRLSAMKLISSLVSEDATFGSLPEVPGAVCSPAAYSVDRKAALAFARRFNLDAYSLRFFAGKAFLASTPRSKRGEFLAANMLMIFDYAPGTPKGWSRVETAGGVKGYIEDRDDMRELSQNHVCFAKVKGSYRITAIFGYGL